MDVFEALYTTRAMRRVKPDPIPVDVQKSILDAAIRAPSGGNSQAWRFLLVDSPEVRAQIAPIYRDCLGAVFKNYYGARIAEAQGKPDDPEAAQFLRVIRSAQWLADNFEVCPLLLFGFGGLGAGGALYPALWSASLAARARGVGSAFTSALAFQKDRVFDVLGVPKDEGWDMTGLVTFGYPTGKWAVAPRIPAHEVSNHNRWDNPLPFAIDRPLWP